MMFLAGAAWGIPFKHQYFKLTWNKEHFIMKEYAHKWQFIKQFKPEYVRFDDTEMSKNWYIKRHWGHWQDTIGNRQTPIEPTPEPVTLVLVGVGLFGLSFIIKRKKGKD